ncbi:MAG: hypothetical protein M1383_02720 [Patescibacteria group bacterium]|nr:hypothetical protein [Patescibacteria group bacterium]
MIEKFKNPEQENELLMFMTDKVIEWLSKNKKVDSAEITILDKREIKEIIQTHKPSDFGSKDFMEFGLEYWAKQYALIWLQKSLSYQKETDELTEAEIKLLLKSKNSLNKNES